jgi:SAM-dependent methyltransferase
MRRPLYPFAHVDDQPDPQFWVDLLDRLRSDPLYAWYKARVAELLDPRPDWRYLEIGVGTGADAIELAGRHRIEVVGVDSSVAMIDEARRRGLAQALVADAHALPFESDRFDGAWADRTFQHLAESETALAELVRVVRPDGVVVVADPDHGTQVVNIPDQDLAERVLRLRAGVGNWRLAHQMARLAFGRGQAWPRSRSCSSMRMSRGGRTRWTRPLQAAGSSTRSASSSRRGESRRPSES